MKKLESQGIKLILVLSLLLLAVPTFATPAHAAGALGSTWAQSYSGSTAQAVARTSDGGYVLAGSCCSVKGGPASAWIAKLGSTGNIVWQDAYGASACCNFLGFTLSGSSDAFSVKQTTDGGYVVAGASSAGSSTWGWILKLDSTGSKLWETLYGEGRGGLTTTSQLFSIQQTSDGGFIAAGQSLVPDACICTCTTCPSGTGTMAALVLKLDSAGRIQWGETFNGTSNAWSNAVQQTSDGGYILAGTASSHAWALKLNSMGGIVWQNTYGGTGFDSANSVEQTSDGGYILAGTTDSFGAGGDDAWIVKLASDGSVSWQKTYGGAGNDEARSVEQTSDGGYVVAGATSSFGAAGSNVWIFKLDTSGSILFQKTYGGKGSDVANSVQQTADGGFVVAGSTSSFGKGSRAWLLKLGSTGDITSCKLDLPTSATVSHTAATITKPTIPGASTFSTLAGTVRTTFAAASAKTAVQCSG